jgi:hypothetical protein
LVVHASIRLIIAGGLEKGFQDRFGETLWRRRGEGALDRFGDRLPRR